MEIYHHGNCIANNAIQATTYLEQAIGLMFKKKFELAEGSALIFPFKKERECDVHMLFVFFDIDVIFLNNDSSIIKTCTLKSWKGRTKSDHTKAIIELPAGSIEKFGIKTGDKISIK